MFYIEQGILNYLSDDHGAVRDPYLYGVPFIQLEGLGHWFGYGHAEAVPDLHDFNGYCEGYSRHLDHRVSYGYT